MKYNVDALAQRRLAWATELHLEEPSTRTHIAEGREVAHPSG
jgi:hypothetical protein